MIGSQRSGVFLSYARKDGEQFAADLREQLRDKAPDIDIKQDRILLEGGVGWWKQLTEAIESVKFLVLVMTTSAMQSETVRKEWRYARQQGVCVYPVKGADDSELKFSELPRWMKKAHFFDIAKEWESFVAHLRKGCDSPRVPFMAPDLPEHFVQREDEFGQLKNLLLSADSKDPVAITTALSGAGGFGKTTLAAALCHDEDIIQNFDDGILWVTLGQKPNVMSGLVTAYAALTGERPGFASEEDAGFQLGQKLEDRTCLFVIDDVWDESHLRPFLRGGKGCARLFTTRNAEIASSKARPINVDEMSSAESRSLLAKAVPGLSIAHARDLSARLGEWPIAIELASAMMRQRIEQGESVERAAQRLSQIIDKKGPRGLGRGTGGHRNIDSVLEGSLDLLGEEDRTRLTELSIFPEDVSIPLTAAALLWQLDEFDAEDTAQRLARLYLLKLDLAKGSMGLHDVMQDWLTSATSNAAELHSRLVDSWQDWMKLPDTYAWRWLPWHLAKAGRKPEIGKLLWDPAWLQAKLVATNVIALIGDCEYLKPSWEAELLQGALRLSSHVLANDCSQFVSQMIGRLLPHRNLTAVQEFIDHLAGAAHDPWLRPLWPALYPPGTALLRTLAGHPDCVYGVAIAPDGRRAVSASRDETLKVWDLESGRELRILEGHSSAVNGVAITPDGRHAVSASGDRTLKVWDLESGCELLTLRGHSKMVNSVAIVPDGRRAVSASEDKTLKVWDLENGRELCTLEGHSSWVTSVAITPDGLRAVSASWDTTLKVWDLQSERELRTLETHSGQVSSVAITPDGLRAVSASWQTLKVWNLENGRELRALESHSGPVKSVALAPDGRRVVFGSMDSTLRVWDLESGDEPQILKGHSSQVREVAIAPDGLRAVSASDDCTLKVWDLQRVWQPDTFQRLGPVQQVAIASDGRRAAASDNRAIMVWSLEIGREPLISEEHFGPVNSVAIAPDGQLAILACSDNTLKVWDLENGRKLHTLQGHLGRINSVAIVPDGRRAVSASEDKTLKVWDLENGRELCTLEGHLQSVRSVAIVADGRIAISASWDKALKVWDVESGRELYTLQGHLDRISSGAISLDGRRAVSASWDKTLKVWDLENGRELCTLEGHLQSVRSVAIVADGRIAISASWDKTLKVWDLDSGQAVATFTCDAQVNCCAIANSHIIVAGDQGGSVHLLELELPPQR